MIDQDLDKRIDALLQHETWRRFHAHVDGCKDCSAERAHQAAGGPIVAVARSLRNLWAWLRDRTKLPLIIVVVASVVIVVSVSRQLPRTGDVGETTSRVARPGSEPRIQLLCNGAGLSEPPRCPVGAQLSVVVAGTEPHESAYLTVLPEGGTPQDSILKFQGQVASSDRIPLAIPGRMRIRVSWSNQASEATAETVTRVIEVTP